MSDIDESLLSGLGLKVARHEEASDQKWKFVFYGDVGTGKTWLAATAEHDPRLAPCIFINREGGKKGIDTLPDPKPYIVDCETQEDVLKVFWWLAGLSARGTNPFKTVIYDTLSEAHESQIVEEVLLRTKKNRSEEAIRFISQNEYKNANSMSRDLIKKLRDLPMHVIVTCHSQDRDTYVGDKVIKSRIELGVSEKAQDPAIRLYDCIAYMDFVKVASKNAKGEEIAEEVRVFHTTKSGRYLSKTRALTERIGDLVEPTMTDIMNRIEGIE